MIRPNTYDAASRHPRRSTRLRAEAFEANLAHYTDVFRDGRDEYAIPAGTLTDPAQPAPARGLLLLDIMGVHRPTARATRSPTRATGRTSRSSATVPTGEAVVWTGVSIIMLLAGIGVMAVVVRVDVASTDRRRGAANDPLLGSTADAVATGGRQVLLGRRRR